MRRALCGLLIAAMLLTLTGCGYILIEDPTASTQVGSPTYKLPTPEPIE